MNIRANELEIGVLIIKSQGAIDCIEKVTGILMESKNNWFFNEIIGLIRRTFSRLDISSRSIFTIVENDSCFGGLLSQNYFFVQIELL